jgi:hypothetical protein
MRQELNQRKLLPVLYATRRQVTSPNSIEQLPVIVVEETDVGQKGRGKEDVSQDRSNLHLEILTRAFPSVFLGRQVVQQVLTPTHLVFNLRHVSYDFLLFTNQRLVLLFQKLGLFLELFDSVGKIVGLLR